VLLDTNVLIIAAQRSDERHPAVRAFLDRDLPFSVSSLTRVELLGWPGDPAVLALREALYDALIEWPLDANVIARATTLRRQRRGARTADMLIAATALAHDLPVVTCNPRDFRWIEGLAVLDPSERGMRTPSGGSR